MAAHRDQDSIFMTDEELFSVVDFSGCENKQKAPQHVEGEPGSGNTTASFEGK